MEQCTSIMSTQYRPYPPFPATSDLSVQNPKNRPPFPRFVPSVPGPYGEFTGTVPPPFVYGYGPPPWNGNCLPNITWHPNHGFCNHGWSPYMNYPPFQCPPGIPMPFNPPIETEIQQRRRVIQPDVACPSSSVDSPVRIPSLRSCASSEGRILPSVESTANILIEENDPIAETMTAVGLNPKILDEIKKKATARSSNPVDSQTHVPASNHVVDPVISSAGSECPICQRYKGKCLRKHMRTHILAVLRGVEEPNKVLTAWFREELPVVLQRNVVCNLCGMTYYMEHSMAEHVAKVHFGEFPDSTFMEIFDLCFPKWNQDQLAHFGFDDDVCILASKPVSKKKSSEAIIGNCCPVCKKVQIQRRNNNSLEDHILGHLHNIILGNEPPNPNLSLWLKENAPQTLERNIFCRLCYAYCSDLVAHVKSKHMGSPSMQIEPIVNYCFPKWTKKQLSKLRFESEKKTVTVEEESSHYQDDEDSCFTIRQDSLCTDLDVKDIEMVDQPPEVETVSVERAVELPKCNFEFLNRVQGLLVDKTSDADATQETATTPDNLVIDFEMENESLLVEEGHRGIIEIDTDMSLVDNDSQPSAEKDVVTEKSGIDSNDAYNLVDRNNEKTEHSLNQTKSILPSNPTTDITGKSCYDLDTVITDQTKNSLNQVKSVLPIINATVESIGNPKIAGKEIESIDCTTMDTSETDNNSAEPTVTEQVEHGLNQSKVISASNSTPGTPEIETEISSVDSFNTNVYMSIDIPNSITETLLTDFCPIITGVIAAKAVSTCDPCDCVKAKTSKKHVIPTPEKIESEMAQMSFLKKAVCRSSYSLVKLPVTETRKEHIVRL